MKVFDRDGLTLMQGDVLAQLRHLPTGHAQTVVTSPPYWGLRSYGLAGQLGLESTPGQYVANIVRVFREVRRVLRSDGTLWLNLGDSYAHGGCGARDPVRWPKQHRNDHMPRHSKKMRVPTIDPKNPKGRHRTTDGQANRNPASGFMPKSLIGIPWRVAIAMQDDGWILRSDIVWHKPNAMPASVKDRPTSAHEFVFLFSKRPHYFYDAEAIRERATVGDHERTVVDQYEAPGQPSHKGLRKIGVAMKAAAAPKQDLVGNPTYSGFNGRWDAAEALAANQWRNKRDVWTISTARSTDEHFAVYPEKLVEPCVLAGSRPGDVVLDPFSGSGTTLAVAARLGRGGVGIDLNPKYHQIAIRRLEAETAQRRLAL